MTRIVAYLRYSDLEKRKIVPNRSTLKRWMDKGTFPRPVRLGPNSLGWPDDEIEARDAALRAARDAKHAAPDSARVAAHAARIAEADAKKVAEGDAEEEPKPADEAA